MRSVNRISFFVTQHLILIYETGRPRINIVLLTLSYLGEAFINDLLILKFALRTAYKTCPKVLLGDSEDNDSTLSYKWFCRFEENGDI